MPVINPIPRTLPQLLDAGGLEVAADLLDQRIYGRRHQKKLEAIFPNAHWQSLRALRSRAIDARASARAAARLPAGETLSDLVAPVNPAYAPGTYATFTIFREAYPGRGPIPLEVKGLDVGSMTLEGARAEAARLFNRAQFETTEGRLGFPVDLVLPEDVDITIVFKGS